MFHAIVRPCSRKQGPFQDLDPDTSWKQSTILCHSLCTTTYKLTMLSSSSDQDQWRFFKQTSCSSVSRFGLTEVPHLTIYICCCDIHPYAFSPSLAHSNTSVEAPAGLPVPAYLVLVSSTLMFHLHVHHSCVHSYVEVAVFVVTTRCCMRYAWSSIVDLFSLFFLAFRRHSFFRRFATQREHRHQTKNTKE